MKPIELRTIGDIVTEDYRAAQVFKKYHLDFCCKGNQTLKEIALKYHIDLQQLLKEIEAKQQLYPTKIFGFGSWPLDLLMQYIKDKHHKYIVERIPIIQQYLKKLGELYGTTNPELFDILELFTQTALELTLHMQKEKSLLFPQLKALSQNKYAQPNGIDTVEANLDHVIHMMWQEHRVVMERFHRIGRLSDNFKAPDHGCSLYRITYSLLKEFEEDLMEHIHLENNILFPKGQLLEKELISQKSPLD
jgi:regulator of cell morphogenesis and NO signaling